MAHLLPDGTKPLHEQLSIYHQLIKSLGIYRRAIQEANTVDIHQ